ncbi:hypothetical protein [Neorhizobium sp. DT-125]
MSAPVQTWRIRLSQAGVQAIRDFPLTRLGFSRENFVADPRIASMLT